MERLGGAVARQVTDAVACVSAWGNIRCLRSWRPLCRGFPELIRSSWMASRAHHAESRVSLAVSANVAEAPAPEQFMPRGTSRHRQDMTSKTGPYRYIRRIKLTLHTMSV